MGEAAYWRFLSPGGSAVIIFVHRIKGSSDHWTEGRAEQLPHPYQVLGLLQGTSQKIEDVLSPAASRSPCPSMPLGHDTRDVGWEYISQLHEAESACPTQTVISISISTCVDRARRSNRPLPSFNGGGEHAGTTQHTSCLDTGISSSTGLTMRPSVQHATHSSRVTGRTYM